MAFKAKKVNKKGDAVKTVVSLRFEAKNHMTTFMCAENRAFFDLHKSAHRSSNIPFILSVHKLFY